MSSQNTSPENTSPENSSLEGIATQLMIDTKRLVDELETLAMFSAAAPPAVTRVLFSDEDMAARAYLKTRCEDLGLSLREDALGNLFARWEGRHPELPAVATGSHIDAIPFSGRYDGTVGVLGALAAFRALQELGYEPKRSLELIVFTAEEPTRFGIGCLGSRALGGVLSAQEIQALRDDTGASPDEVRKARGIAGNLAELALGKGYYHSFLELHIEQGPLLEAAKLNLGVVTAIAAPASLTVTVTGQGGHAGAVLMPQRYDALTAAADMALAVEKIAKTAAQTTPTHDSVATVGIFEVHPAAVNSIPSQVKFTIDCRDTDLARRDGMVADIQTQIADIAAQRGVKAELEVLNADAPTSCHPDLMKACSNAADRLELSWQQMVSRAYHDTLFMAQVCPVGMLFIPCEGGISHRPDEYSSPQDITNGVRALALALSELAG
ncbi:MAG: M20 family metallo-hydrolase [Deinococcota bacterium]